MNVTRTPGSPVLRWLAIALCLGSAACGPGANDIVLFTLNTVTGPQGTDADQYLCFSRRANATRFECLEISSAGNDFEADHAESFELEPDEEIETDAADASPTGIEAIVFENRGGGFGNEDWDLVSFELRAMYGDDSEYEICAESGLTGVIASGAKFNPTTCP